MREISSSLGETLCCKQILISSLVTTLRISISLISLTEQTTWWLITSQSWPDWRTPSPKWGTRPQTLKLLEWERAKTPTLRAVCKLIWCRLSSEITNWDLILLTTFLTTFWTSRKKMFPTPSSLTFKIKMSSREEGLLYTVSRMRICLSDSWKSSCVFSTSQRWRESLECLFLSCSREDSRSRLLHKSTERLRLWTSLSQPRELMEITERSLKELQLLSLREATTRIQSQLSISHLCIPQLWWRITCVTPRMFQQKERPSNIRRIKFSRPQTAIGSSVKKLKKVFYLSFLRSWSVLESKLKKIWKPQRIHSREVCWTEGSWLWKFLQIVCMDSLAPKSANYLAYRYLQVLQLSEEKWLRWPRPR